MDPFCFCAISRYIRHVEACNPVANAGCQLELQRLKRNHKPAALLQQQQLDSSGGGRQQAQQEAGLGAGAVLAPRSYTASPSITLIYQASRDNTTLIPHTFDFWYKM